MKRNNNKGWATRNLNYERKFVGAIIDTYPKEDAKLVLFAFMNE
jgi:hypothetical protein